MRSIKELKITRRKSTIPQKRIICPIEENITLEIQDFYVCEIKAKAMADIIPPTKARELFLDSNYNSFDMNTKKRILESVATHLKSMDFSSKERVLWHKMVAELDSPSRVKIREILLESLKKKPWQ